MAAWTCPLAAFVIYAIYDAEGAVEGLVMALVMMAFFAFITL